MYQGFYELTSGMLTQKRRLNVISNNISNMQTPGYKADTQVDSTFQEQMVIRTGTRAKKDPTSLAQSTPIVTADRVYTNYSQGTFEETGGVYDFAISGDGFFRVNVGGSVMYTRDGCFSVTDNGTLQLDDIGTVMGTDGQPIVITDDNFSVSGNGTITNSDGTVAGQLSLANFADLDGMHKEDNGMYTSGGQAEQPVDSGILWQSLEQSNAEPLEQMTSMMSAQRALQSCAQMLKMYDQINAKSVEIGKA